MQARLRAQLGDRSKYSGERRRRSVVVASIVLTITDPLRGSYPLLCNLQAALIRSCGASFACMELTIISRFQRLQASTNRQFIVFQCFRQRHVSNAITNCGLYRNMPKARALKKSRFLKTKTKNAYDLLLFFPQIASIRL